MYLTADGIQRFKSELSALKAKRSSLADKLKAARLGGDLKENADYDDAKEQLGFVEGRINRLESDLASAKLLTKPMLNTVSLGAIVVVKAEDSDKAERFHIVSSAEAEPRSGRISDRSPLGTALIGKAVGAEVIGNKVRFTLLGIF